MNAKGKEFRDPEMERLGVTQPLITPFKVNKVKQLELREVIFVVRKDQNTLNCPLDFYFSCFILTLLLQRSPILMSLSPSSICKCLFENLFFGGSGSGWGGLRILSLPGLFS